MLEHPPFPPPPPPLLTTRYSWYRWSGKETPVSRESLDHQGPPAARVQPGTNGDPGLPGPRGHSPNTLLTIHSQTNSNPECPRNGTLLWNGFSLIFTDGNGFGHGQDLGAPGSWRGRMFNPVPLMMCNRRTDGTLRLQLQKRV